MNKMIEVKNGNKTTYKSVPDDYVCDGTDNIPIGDLTTSEKKYMSFSDIPKERWDDIFKKQERKRKAMEEGTKAQQIFGEMLIISEQYKNISLDKNVGERIAKFRARTGMPITVCPCDPKSTERGCIGKKCFKEILENGVCHCLAYRRIKK